MIFRLSMKCRLFPNNDLYGFKCRFIMSLYTIIMTDLVMPVLLIRLRKSLLLAAAMQQTDFDVKHLAITY